MAFGRRKRSILLLVVIGLREDGQKVLQAPNYFISRAGPALASPRDCRKCAITPCTNQKIGDSLCTHCREAASMDPSAISADAYRLVRTLQVFGAWPYNGWETAQRELLSKRLAKLDITRTRLVLTEWGWAVPREAQTAQ